MHNRNLILRKLSRTSNGKSKLYSPQINQQSVFMLRRIAWAAGKPMTSCLDQIIGAVLPKINITNICTSCKDNQQCAMCPFKMQLPTYPDIEKLLIK